MPAENGCPARRRATSRCQTGRVPRTFADHLGVPNNSPVNERNRDVTNIYHDTTKRLDNKVQRGFGSGMILFDMSRFFVHLQWLMLGFAFVQGPTILHADECVKFHKRAPMKAVCGRVTNAAGESLTKVELILTAETGAVHFTASSENEGRFSFGSIPKGDYLLRAKGPVGYFEVQREIRVTKNNQKRCSPKIEISLGPSSCMSGTRIKGVDKPSDLESELVK
jgi:hypothetical protein